MKKTSILDFTDFIYLFLIALLIPMLAGCATRPDPTPTSTVWGSPAPEAARLLIDTDQDRLSDDRESMLGTNANLPDTDGDGFTDGFEVEHGEFRFDPLRSTIDSDRDGLPDSLEHELGSSPTNPDSDGDRYGDFDEYLNRLNGYDLIRPTEDRDFDGLGDDFELRIGSSPDLVDSNSDGISDFQAHHAGFAVNVTLMPPMAELIGITYSHKMGSVIEEMRAGHRGALASIAEQLPYPAVTSPFVSAGVLDPSAALMQRAVHNPTNSPAFYRPYSEIVTELFALRDHFDGSPGPDIVRLFVWSAPTLNCCDGEDRNRPGEKIYLLKISDNPQVNENEPEVALMGMHHGRELITVTITTNFASNLTSEYEAGDARARGIVDGNEIWLLPVVNPNGYERARAVQADWRKNTRRVSPTQVDLGVDLNRNYSAGHATLLTVAQRAALSATDRTTNGITSSGGFDENSFQYPHTSPISEVETQAVRGLGLSHFNTNLGREEIDGIGCSLSWHSYTGLIGHPMGHDPIPPEVDLTATERTSLGKLTAAFSSVTAYGDHTDQWRHTNYAVFGDSEDWWFKDRGSLSTFVEAYSIAEGRVGSSFYPPTAAEADAVAKNNYEGVLALIGECPL